jgi:hypothetical protein
MEYVVDIKEESEENTDIIPLDILKERVGTGLPDETSSLSIAQVPTLHVLKKDDKLTFRSSVKGESFQ